MAATYGSCSDSSNSTTRGFDITSSIEERTSISLEKCPVCLRLKRDFYCQECIRNGDFTRSKACYPERFAEKKLKLYKLNQTRQELVESCREHIARKIKLESLHNEISECHRQVQLLQLAVQETRNKASQRKAESKQIRADISVLKAKAPLFEQKLAKLQSHADASALTADKHRDTLSKTESTLQDTKRAYIQELLTYIFPIVEVSPVQRSQSSSGESTASEAHLIDLVDSRSEVHYRIVEPTLPASGDYSAYSLWVAQPKDTVPVAPSAVELRNPAYNISAALTYLTQLVSILAFYLDVRLPKRLSFSEFCGYELSEEQFLHRVAMLNTNVLHLCFSQNVDPRLLHPRHTVQNILALVDGTTTGLGRYGPYEPNDTLAARMEESFAKELLEEEEKDECRDAGQEPELSDWETVNVTAIPAGDAGPTYQRGSYSTMTVPAQQNNPYRPSSATTTTSIAGGLMSSAAASVASLWRKYM